MRTYCVTYEIVTPESAEEGDASERGFCDGGSHYIQIPMPPGLCGDAVKAWADQFSFDVEVTPDDWEGFEPALVEVLQPERYSCAWFLFAHDNENWYYKALEGDAVPGVIPPRKARIAAFPKAYKVRPTKSMLAVRLFTGSLDADPYVNESEACVRAMAKIILDAGATEGCSSHHSPGDWWTAVDADHDFRTGETTSYSYHLDGWTPEEERMIARLVKAGDASADLDGI